MSSVSLTLNGGTNLTAQLRTQIEKEAKAAEHEIARRHTAAMKRVAASYEATLRADVKASGMKGAAGMSKAWKARVYPNGKPSVGPAIWISGRGVWLDAFELPATINGRGGKYLVIPSAKAQAILGAMPRLRDDAGRYAARQKLDAVAAALGIPRLTARGHPGKDFVLVDPRTGIAYFYLVHSARLTKRLHGRQLLATFTGRWEADFKAALASA